MELELGRCYRDWITGFEGRATAITSYLSGSVKLCLQAEGLDGNGVPRAEQWFDAARLSDAPDGHERAGFSRERNMAGAEVTP